MFKTFTFGVLSAVAMAQQAAPTTTAAGPAPGEDFDAWAAKNCDMSPQDAVVAAMANDPENFDAAAFSQKFIQDHCGGVEALIAEQLTNNVPADDPFMVWAGENCSRSPIDVITEAAQTQGADFKPDEAFQMNYMQTYCDGKIYVEAPPSDDPFFAWAAVNCSRQPMDVLQEVMATQGPGYEPTEQDQIDYMLTYCNGVFGEESKESEPVRQDQGPDSTDLSTDDVMDLFGENLGDMFSGNDTNTNTTDLTTDDVMDLFGDGLGDMFSGDDKMDWDMSMNHTDDMWGNHTDDMWGNYTDMNYTDDMWGNYTYNESDWNQTWDQTWDDSLDFNDTDWFGALVNADCQDECYQSDCGFGVQCWVNQCRDICTNTTTCSQDVLKTWDSEWENYDCSNGIVELKCEEECEYTECEDSEYEVCWEENCFDGCGNNNCSVWFQVDGDWYGQECEDGSAFADFRPQDLINGINQIGLAYGDTIDSLWDLFCDPNDPQCTQGRQDLDAAFNGRTTNSQQLQTPSANETAFVSQAVNQVVGEVWTNFTQDVLPMVNSFVGDIFTPEVQGILDSVKNDTQASMPGADLQVLDVLTNVNSTDALVQQAESQFSLGNIVNSLDALVQQENDEQLNSFWGAFTSGLRNSGSDRKGKRD